MALFGYGVWGKVPTYKRFNKIKNVTYMIEIVYQAPWLDNDGFYCFTVVDISMDNGNGRIAFGLFGFLIGIVFHTR